MSLRSEAVDAVYASWEKDVMFKSTWMGVLACKNPCDAWRYQEIIFQNKPDLIIETGTFKGGGAWFLASMRKLAGLEHGRVITMDVIDYKMPEHPMITFIHASSHQPAVIRDIELMAKDKKVMVVLDSDHDASHVRKELAGYHSLVTPGQYMIVEDTWWKDGSGGPWDAVQEFLKDHPEFEIDKSHEVYKLTNNPNGYLRKK